MSRGYAQIAIHNGEAYELTNEEFLELESRLEKLGVDEYHPLSFKETYEYLLELGYEVEPPNPDLVPKKEDAPKTTAVSADARQKAWNKEKILREQARLVARERKVLEREKQLDEAIAKLQEQEQERKQFEMPPITASGLPLKSRFKPTGSKWDVLAKLIDDLAIYYHTQRFHRKALETKLDAELQQYHAYHRTGMGMGMGLGRRGHPLEEPPQLRNTMATDDLFGCIGMLAIPVAIILALTHAC